MSDFDLMPASGQEEQQQQSCHSGYVCTVRGYYNATTGHLIPHTRKSPSEMAQLRQQLVEERVARGGPRALAVVPISVVVPDSTTPTTTTGTGTLLPM